MLSATHSPSLRRCESASPSPSWLVILHPRVRKDPDVYPGRRNQRGRVSGGRPSAPAARRRNYASLYGWRQCLHHPKRHTSFRIIETWMVEDTKLWLAREACVDPVCAASHLKVAMIAHHNYTKYRLKVDILYFRHLYVPRRHIQATDNLSHMYLNRYTISANSKRVCTKRHAC